MNLTATAIAELANTLQDMQIVAARDRRKALESNAPAERFALYSNAVVVDHWAARIEAILGVLRTENEG